MAERRDGFDAARARSAGDAVVQILRRPELGLDGSTAQQFPLHASARR